MDLDSRALRCRAARARGSRTSPADPGLEAARRSIRARSLGDHARREASSGRERIGEAPSEEAGPAHPNVPRASLLALLPGDASSRSFALSARGRVRARWRRRRTTNSTTGGFPCCESTRRRVASPVARLDSPPRVASPRASTPSYPRSREKRVVSWRREEASRVVARRPARCALRASEKSRAESEKCVPEGRRIARTRIRPARSFAAPPSRADPPPASARGGQRSTGLIWRERGKKKPKFPSHRSRPVGPFPPSIESRLTAPI